jgi:hypothetical protein
MAIWSSTRPLSSAVAKKFSHSIPKNIRITDLDMVDVCIILCMGLFMTMKNDQKFFFEDADE